jgi:ABC-type ATPase with predicted acetyltransferase domain
MTSLADVTVERHERDPKHRLSLMDEIYVEAGGVEDWNLLHELHYKAENLAAGPEYFRAMFRGRTIGVGVLTNPQFLSAGRNAMFPHMKPNQGGKDTKVINEFRGKEMNRIFRCNSRLVVDTVFRGAGVAYRLQNIMMRMSGAQVVEFQSSMSKFNPFAGKAGVKFGKPRRSPNYEKGLSWFLTWFECHPTDKVGVLAELDSMPAPVRERCVAEMRKLYYQCSAMEKSGDNRMNGTSRVDAMPLVKLVEQLQQVIFASPLYGVYMNPDHGRELPTQIPILAFDNQPTDAPLDLSKL